MHCIWQPMTSVVGRGMYLRCSSILFDFHASCHRIHLLMRIEHTASELRNGNVWFMALLCTCREYYSLYPCSAAHKPTTGTSPVCIPTRQKPITGRPRAEDCDWSKPYDGGSAVCSPSCPLGLNEVPCGFSGRTRSTQSHQLLVELGHLMQTIRQAYHGNASIWSR